MKNNSDTSSTPDSSIIREITIGGISKTELIKKLKKHEIHLNQYAEQLLSDSLLTISSQTQTLNTIEITVKQLGFSTGANLEDIFNKAAEIGLDLCPLELAPFMRLQYKDQPENPLNKPESQHKAPSTSITIASQIPDCNDNFPKGFYLINYQGTLWLRGYISSLDHTWNPEDRFIFIKK